MSSPPATPGRSALPPEHAGDGARALAAAVSQIELALREAHVPVEKLGGLIERMSRTVGEVGHAATPGSDTARTVERLEAELFAGIQELQFFDRMVQHLSHVQDYLTSVANELASTAERGSERTEAWEELRTRLRTRLISDAQRELLDMVLMPALGLTVAEPDHASQGSVELF